MEIDLPIAVNVLCFLIGLLVGHRLALGRDRRNDLNRAVTPVRDLLLTQRGRPDPRVKRPTPAQLDWIGHFLPRRLRRGFARACETYEQRHTEQAGPHPGAPDVTVMLPVYRDPAPVAAAIDDLLRYVRPR